MNWLICRLLRSHLSIEVTQGLVVVGVPDEQPPARFCGPILRHREQHIRRFQITVLWAGASVANVTFEVPVVVG